MKGYIINKYYDFLIFLEDVLYYLEKKVNDHRKKVDDKYWQEYIFPVIQKKEEELYYEKMETRKNYTRKWSD